MEATGNYSALLLYMLNVAGITVSMENPLKVKNFAKALLSTVKTDKSDARLITLYGEKMNPRPFKVQGEAILRLRQKRTVIRQLTKQITAMSNLRGSLACLPVPDKGATHTVDETIKFLEKMCIRDRGYFGCQTLHIYGHGIGNGVDIRHRFKREIILFDFLPQR